MAIKIRIQNVWKNQLKYEKRLVQICFISIRLELFNNFKGLHINILNFYLSVGFTPTKNTGVGFTPEY